MMDSASNRESASWLLRRADRAFARISLFDRPEKRTACKIPAHVNILESHPHTNCISFHFFYAGLRGIGTASDQQGVTGNTMVHDKLIRTASH